MPCPAGFSGQGNEHHHWSQQTLGTGGHVPAPVTGRGRPRFSSKEHRAAAGTRHWRAERKSGSDEAPAIAWLQAVNVTKALPAACFQKGKPSLLLPAGFLVPRSSMTSRARPAARFPWDEASETGRYYTRRRWLATEGQRSSGKGRDDQKTWH